MFKQEDGRTYLSGDKLEIIKDLSSVMEAVYRVLLSEYGKKKAMFLMFEILYMSTRTEGEPEDINENDRTYGYSTAEKLVGEFGELLKKYGESIPAEKVNDKRMN